MDNLWSRRNNSSKLSLSTSGSNGQHDGSSRNSPLPKRLGGDSSSHGRTNPFNSITTPGSIASPNGNASSAFGLGSGAFASFGAKTPKSPGNPFEATVSGGAKTPTAERSAKDGAPQRSAGKATTGADAKASGSAMGRSSAASTATTAHQLRNSWTFWFRPPIPKRNEFVDYEKTLHAVATCETAEQFFAVYRHLKRPSMLPQVSEYHLFKKGVRPIWEDEENKKGGKWIVRLKKGVADRYWEDLLLAIIGDQFGEASEEVCGVVLSVRTGEDILSIWTRTTGGRVLKIRETMKRVLSFPPETKVEWKSHDSSIQHRTAIEEFRREKAANSNNHHHDKHSAKPQHAQQDEEQRAPATT